MLARLELLGRDLGDKPALVYEGAELSFQKLARACRSLAGRLTAEGSGERVCVDLADQLHSYLGLLAGLGTGCEVSVARPDMRSAGELPDWLGVPLSRLVSDPIEVGGDAAARTAADGPGEPGALISVTTGSTGAPKGVRISGKAVRERNHIVTQALRLTRDDVVLASLHIGIAYAQTVYLPALLQGATIVLSPVDEEAVLALAERHGATVLITTPTAWWGMTMNSARAAAALRGLRLPAIGAEPIPLELAERVRRAAGCWPSLLYGATEAGLVLLGKPAAGGHRFKPVAGVSCTTEPRDDGLWSLLVDGPLFDGYILPTGEISSRPPGAWHTGDIVETWPDGSLTIVGRADSRVKRGKRWVDLHAIESDISLVPAVKRVCVTAVHLDHAGELIVALVSSADSSLTPARLMRLLRSREPRGELPDFVLQCDELPEVAGKLDRSGAQRTAAELLGRRGETARRDT